MVFERGFVVGVGGVRRIRGLWLGWGDVLRGCRKGRSAEIFGGVVGVGWAFWYFEMKVEAGRR